MEKEIDIAKRLVNARKMKGWSLQEAADKLTELGKKITKQGLHRYEKGEIKFDSATLSLFSKLYSVSVDYFFRKTIDIELTNIHWCKTKY